MDVNDQQVNSLLYIFHADRIELDIKSMTFSVQAEHVCLFIQHELYLIIGLSIKLYKNGCIGRCGSENL